MGYIMSKSRHGEKSSFIVVVMLAYLCSTDFSSLSQIAIMEVLALFRKRWHRCLQQEQSYPPTVAPDLRFIDLVDICINT